MTGAAFQRQVSLYPQTTDPTSHTPVNEHPTSSGGGCHLLKSDDRPQSFEEYVPVEKIPQMVKKLRKEMLAAAKELNFERAAELRDRVKKLEDMELALK